MLFSRDFFPTIDSPAGSLKCLPARETINKAVSENDKEQKFGLLLGLSFRDFSKHDLNYSLLIHTVLVNSSVGSKP